MKKRILIGIGLLMILCMAGCNPFKMLQSAMDNQAQQVPTTEENLVSEIQTEDLSEEESIPESAEVESEVSSDSGTDDKEEADKESTGYLDIRFERIMTAILTKSN